MTDQGQIRQFLPRLLRLRDAPFYLGMNKNLFNEQVRPHLIELRISKQGVAFDRLDLDAWVDQYKACNGRPVSNMTGEKLWDAEEYQGSVNEPGSGTLKSRSSDKRFAKALAQAASKKRS